MLSNKLKGGWLGCCLSRASASGQRNYRLPDRLDQNRSFPQDDSICSMKQSGLAASARNPPCAYSKGTISSATMLMILISGLTAGPAVSL